MVNKIQQQRQTSNAFAKKRQLINNKTMNVRKSSERQKPQQHYALCLVVLFYFSFKVVKPEYSDVFFCKTTQHKLMRYIQQKRK